MTHLAKLTNLTKNKDETKRDFSKNWLPKIWIPQKIWFPHKEQNLVPKRTDEETVRSLRSAAQMAENLPEGRSWWLGSFWSKPLKMEHPALMEHRGIFPATVAMLVFFFGVVYKKHLIFSVQPRNLTVRPYKNSWLVQMNCLHLWDSRDS